MSFFSKFFNKPSNTIQDLLRPWDKNKQSLYSFIFAHIDEDGKIMEEGHELPDEIKQNGLSFSPGMIDGVMSFHFKRTDGSQEAAKIFALIKELTSKPNNQCFSALYKLLLETETASFADDLYVSIRQDLDLNYQEVVALALVLAMEAPDRKPIKFALTVLGCFSHETFIDIFMLFGRHDEFTLFSAVAIMNTVEDYEPLLWELAQSVDGWGRIQLVRRLAKTKNEEIKRWMLTDGYKNSIMNEYLALVCAYTGELHSALEQSEIDDAIFNGASEIIEALLDQEGPAENIDSYEHSASVIKNYMKHAEKRELSISNLVTIKEIKKFIDEHVDQDEKGWNVEIIEEIKQKALKIISSPEWREKILKGLSSKKSKTFYTAAQVAEDFDIDVWQFYYDRLESGEDNNWGNLLSTTDSVKLDKALALAEKKLPLDKIATGPELNSGFGEDINLYLTMQFFAQTLENFPGKGFVFVDSMLKNPVIGLREKAIKVLSTWGKDFWPQATVDILNQAYEIEPDKKVKEEIGKLISG